jgi:putative transposase
MLVRRQLRLHGHDYTQPGAYFVTLSTIGRRCHFGEIAGDAMKLNRAGEIVATTWRNLGTHYQHLDVDEFAVMPNHLHGVLVFSPGNQTRLPDVVGAFKSFSARSIGHSVWQRSYHDRIVRDEEEMARVRQYVANNPLQWALDEENPDQ